MAELQDKVDQLTAKKDYVGATAAQTATELELGAMAGPRGERGTMAELQDKVQRLAASKAYAGAASAQAELDMRLELGKTKTGQRQTVER